MLFRRSIDRSARRGFTLVEMLVAVGLVVLMMALFAKIFEMATGAMSKQKGVAENDQRARLTTTLIQNDVGMRTYRLVYPLLPGTAPHWSAQQKGYFAISENDPTDDTDDVLSFTIFTENRNKNQDATDTSPIYGKSVACDGAPGVGGPSYYYYQPEFDDGQFQPNGGSLSRFAEVCYFLRKGKLYRRVMLLREPFSDKEPMPRSPISAAYSTTIASTGNGGTGNFWTDFDFSAYNNMGLPSPPVRIDAPQFLFANAVDTCLSNEFKNLKPLPLTTNLNQVGMPNMRFGHNIMMTGTNPGIPREWVPKFIDSSGATQNTPAFIGRFTHEETSNSAFGYPGTWNGPPDGTQLPMNRTDLILGADGVVQGFNAGSRIGEDILMSNVHAFDVKVFDEHTNVKDYRDVGYAETNTTKQGFFWSGNKLTDFGPQPGTANNFVFDTWNPNFDFNKDLAYNDLPPFLPCYPGVNGVRGDGDDDEKPLRSIQIRIRFLDTTSNQMRDVTLIESLTDR